MRSEEAGPDGPAGGAGWTCPGTPGTVGGTLGLLADTWTLLILQRAFLGVRRYVGWRETLNISDATLTARLRAMTENGLLHTSPYRDGGGRSRREYRLTERGLDVWRLLLVTWNWERVWEPRDVPLPDVVHRVCGQVTDVVLCCRHCGEPVGPRDTEVPAGAVVTVGAELSRVHPRRTRGRLPEDPLSFLPGAMEIIGDRWGATLLGASLVGLRTFSEYAEHLSISPEVLTDRLRRFVEHGVLDRTGQTGYRLTDKGRAAFAILACLVDWANRWPAADGIPVDLDIRHRACGRWLRVRLDCAVCGVPLERDLVGPSFPGHGPDGNRLSSGPAGPEE